MKATEFSQKDLALRAVGRTVVNFQRLEHNLKLAAPLGPVQGTLLKVQQDVKKRIERAATLTLGQAIRAWLAATQNETVNTNHTPDLFDITVETTVSWGIGEESQTAHASALKTLLEARNNLIHGGLVHTKWDSPEECERLIAELSSVNDSIATELEFVTSVLQAFASLQAEHLDALHRAVEGQLAQEKRGAGDA